MAYQYKNGKWLSVAIFETAGLINDDTSHNLPKGTIIMPAGMKLVLRGPEITFSRVIFTLWRFALCKQTYPKRFYFLQYTKGKKSRRFPI